MSKLVIVESPTKAKTISKFLGKEFKVESSFGHVRDLPKSKLGVDVDRNFEPSYSVPVKSKKRVKELKTLAEKSEEVFFATDEDREGEAISWHLAQLFKKDIEQTKRITFHEITEDAIKEALANPRIIDINLVDAQQARRVLDRLVGYKLSPLLWKKIARGLSAGRVQSVAVRLIVEKEREIENFKPKEYWEISAEFKGNENIISARLHKINNKTLDKFDINNEEHAGDILKELENNKYYVYDISQKETSKNPLPPFTTSSLQQEANRRFGFSAKQTMMLAQQLYEGADIGGESIGLITYMRTDSLNLSQKFLDEATDYIKKEIGNDYYKRQVYKTNKKGAQEAHEAIRPTAVKNLPDNVRDNLNPNQFKLYQLIWQRALASQMTGAKLNNTAIDINTKDNKYTFRANGQVIVFDGFLKIYPASTKEELLPQLTKNKDIECQKIDPQQKFTQPPARYSEATLVKAMEEKGIGRPSTYAPTIATIIDRGYIEKLEKRRLKPTDIALVVNDLLVEHFPKIVDYDFTAKLEEDLDDIAEGEKRWQPIVSQFYGPFIENLEQKEKELNKKELTEEATDEKCEKCKSPMVIKIGRFGKFLACSNYPECKNTKNITADGKIEINEPKKLDEKCPECGNDLVLRIGRFGEFKGCSNYPNCKYIKNEKQKDLGISCPKCKKGSIVNKRSRRGMFYGCDKYPECDFAFWGQPNGEKCEKCGYPMTEDKKGNIKCSNKECN